MTASSPREPESKGGTHTRQFGLTTETEGVIELGWSIIEQLALDLRSPSPTVRAEAWHTVTDPNSYPMDLFASWAGIEWPEIREVYGSRRDSV
jgi:hypothetical protein